jgi:choice-of-anchor C domain-containing protein
MGVRFPPMKRSMPPMVVLLLAALALPARAQISNGSFEAGPNPGAVMTLPEGSTAVPGWIATRDAIRYVGSHWNASEGTRSIALNAATAGGIAQTFATTPGLFYRVAFSMGSDAFPAKPYIKWLRVEAAGMSQDFSFDGIHAWPWDIGWADQFFFFTANATTTTLEFHSLMEAATDGPAIDHVRIDQAVDATPLESAAVTLAAPWPNPAAGAFDVAFTLPAAAPVRLSLCDLQGREIGVLAEGTLPAGRHVRAWGRDAARATSAGIYFLRLETAGITKVRRIALTQ